MKNIQWIISLKEINKAKNNENLKKINHSNDEKSSISKSWVIN